MLFRSSSATINYTGSPFCSTVSAAQFVAQSGTIGGTYSALPSGLTIDAASGAIVPSTSTAGNYTVTYAITAGGGCSAFSTTAAVAVNTAPTASISYSAAPFCTSDTVSHAVAQSGTIGGTYSSAVGLSLNATTGAIKPSTSTAGNYTVTYTIAAASGCAAVTATYPVTITAAPTAAITYSGSPFCKSLTTAQAVGLTGTSGGTYTALPSGLSIDAATGAITPSTSVAGNYIVTYSIAPSGGCVAISTTANVSITTAPTADIVYSFSPICTSLTTPVSVTQSGSVGGTFSVAPAGLALDTINGNINPSVSAGGNYVVTYTIAAFGGCAAVTDTANVAINPAPGPAGTITSIGNDSVSVNETNVLYTVPAIAYATSYIWTYSDLGGGVLATVTTATDSVKLNFSSTVPSGNLTVKGHNDCGDGVLSTDYPVYVSQTGINETNNSLTYQIYPNPTKGIVTININGINTYLELQIVNVQGITIASEKLAKGNSTYHQEIDLSMYPRGIYFVKLTNKNFTKVEKLILQ